MKKIIIEPTIADEEVVVQFTDIFTVDKSVFVNVPSGYETFVFIGEKIIARIPQSSEKRLIEYGKEFLNQKCRIAFLRFKNVPPIRWGFGNVTVNCGDNGFCRIGANGKLRIEIVEKLRFVNYFEHSSNITVEKIRNAFISKIKDKGIELLGSVYAKSNIPISEFSSKTSDFGNELFDAVKNDSVFAEHGVCIKDLTVDGIFINEDDLNEIRKNEQNKNSEKEEIKKYANEIRQNREQIVQVVSEQLEEFKTSLISDIDDRFQESFPLRESAQPEYVNELDLTAQLLIDNAKDSDDFVPAASMIYSNVEENLINNFDLKYEDNKFLIDYDEYMELAENATIGDYYLLKKKNNATGEYNIIVPHESVTDEDSGNTYVEMLPVVRFIKAGMSYENAHRAAEKWMILNKIRHRSSENQVFLDRFFNDNMTSEREYLTDTLNFFKSNNLYTKE